LAAGGLETFAGGVDIGDAEGDVPGSGADLAGFRLVPAVGEYAPSPPRMEFTGGTGG
jgi:hypothetical protein